MQLEHKDIDLLMEGLESIEKAQIAGDAMGDMMGSLFVGMASKEDPAAMEKFQRERDLERTKRAASRRRKQEDVFLLRAKLVGLRRELDGEVAERIVSEARA